MENLRFVVAFWAPPFPPTAPSLALCIPGVEAPFRLVPAAGSHTQCACLFVEDRKSVV